MRLYYSGCSYLDDNGIIDDGTKLSKLFKINTSIRATQGGSSNEMIFKKSYLNILKNDFDFVLIGWSHPERSIRFNLGTDMDSITMKRESNSDLITSNFNNYESILPGHGNVGASQFKFEPHGTDDTIIYTTILHNLLNQKEIPHLFINMGKLNKDVIDARIGWLELINPKNYYGSGTISDKFKFSMIEQFVNDEMNVANISDNSVAKYGSNEIPLELQKHIRDTSGHLNKDGYSKLSEYLYQYIIDNALI
jgi:hypothetical protein